MTGSKQINYQVILAVKVYVHALAVDSNESFLEIGMYCFMICFARAKLKQVDQVSVICLNLCDLFNSNSNLSDPGKCPYKSPPKRGGENRQDKSAEIYMRETNNGKRQLTAAREQDLNLKVFSIQ